MMVTNIWSQTSVTKIDVGDGQSKLVSSTKWLCRKLGQFLAHQDWKLIYRIDILIQLIFLSIEFKIEMDLKLTESPSFSSDINLKISTNESSDTGSEVSPIKQKSCKYCDAVFKVSNTYFFDFMNFFSQIQTWKDTKEFILERSPLNATFAERKW